MKIIIVSLLLFFCFNLTAQNYFPRHPGSKWIYKMAGESFIDHISEQKVVFNQQEYFQSIRKYSWGDTDTSYFRVAKDGTVYYLDSHSTKESIDVPSNPKLSFYWMSSDNAWRYEIVEVNATLNTPSRSFTDCIVIKAEQMSDRDKNKLQVYFNYYSKILGYVGSKLNSKLMSYLDEWKLN